MLKLKSIIILIITIFSFIMPFMAMPFANASNVAHAQTQTMTVADIYPDPTQWVTNVLNGKYIVTAFFPATGSEIQIYFFNMTSSGVIQDVFYTYQTTAPSNSYVDSSAISYGGNNIYYVAWQSGSSFYLGEFNLTSKAFTVLNSFTAVDSLGQEDGAVIVSPFSNYPVAIFECYNLQLGNAYFYFLTKNGAYNHQFTQYSSGAGWITGAVAYGGFPNANDYWLVIASTIGNQPQIDIVYYNSTANTINLEEAYTINNVYDYNNEFGFYMFSYYGQNVLNSFSATLVYSDGYYYVNIPLAYGVLNTPYTVIYGYQFGLNTNYESENPIVYVKGGQGYIMADYMGASNKVFTIYVYNPTESYYLTYNESSGLPKNEGSLGNVNYPTFYIGAEPMQYNLSAETLTFTTGVYTPPNVITPPQISTSTLSNSTGVQTPTPTSNSSATAINIYYINSAMRFMLPLLFILLPAIILMVYLGTKGFIGGLSLGMVIGVYAGFIPIWALVFLGIVMLFLIFWRERGEVSV